MGRLLLTEDPWGLGYTLHLSTVVPTGISRGVIFVYDLAELE